MPSSATKPLRLNASGISRILRVGKRNSRFFQILPDDLHGLLLRVNRATRSPSQDRDGATLSPRLTAGVSGFHGEYLSKRQPLSTMELARDIMAAFYNGYLSSERGRSRSGDSNRSLNYLAGVCAGRHRTSSSGEPGNLRCADTLTTKCSP